MLQRNKFGAVSSTFNIIIQSKFSKLIYTTKTVNIGKSSASQRKKYCHMLMNYDLALKPIVVKNTLVIGTGRT